jgi:hypothetical protein
MRYRSAWRLAAVVVGGLVCAAPSAAQEKKPAEPPPGVKDEAGLFGEDARKKAIAEIADIKKRFQKDLVIETLKEAPGAKDADLSTPAAKNKFFFNLAAKRAQKAGAKGIYVLITLEPKRVEVIADGPTRKGGFFTGDDCNALAPKIGAKLKADERDAALLDAVAFVRQTLTDRSKDKEQPKKDGAR